MLSLLFLLVVAAVVTAAAVVSLTRPPEPVPAAPHLPLALGLPASLFGLRWRSLGPKLTRAGVKTLWIADDGDRAQFVRLYDADRERMRALGFGWGSERQEDPEYSPVCWEVVPAPPESLVVEHVAIAVAKAAAADELQARRAAEREEEERRLKERLAVAEAERDEREMTTRLEAIAELKQRIDAYPWAWTKGQRADIAEVLARADRPRAVDYVNARRLIYVLDEMLDRVGYRLSNLKRAEWWDRAADVDVRAAALTACRILSSLDADHASLDNGVGWSKAHSHAGHLLSAKAELTQTEASHALRAVWAHRRQIRPELRAAIFGQGA